MRKTIREAQTYLQRIRRYIWFSLVVFLVSVGAGYYFAQHYPAQLEIYLAEIKTFFASMQATTPWETFLMILQNNVEAMLLVVAMGVFAGLFSLTFLVTNGVILGVFAYLFAAQGEGLVFLAGILPHGIIEIPCLLFAAAIGLRIGITAVRRLAGRQVSLTQEMAEGVKCAITVIVPLLVVAAFIETYITPLFIALAQLAVGA